MTDQSDEKAAGQAGHLRGWSFVGAVVMAAVLGVAYVAWKYYKHHVLLPELLGPHMWVIYAVGVAGLFVWGVATRFGTKR